MAELAIPLTPPPGRENDPYYNITAEEERYRVSATITDGVVPLKRLIKGNILTPETYLGTCFSLVPGDGLSVILSPGVAVCGHTYYMNTEFKRFTLCSAAPETAETHDIVIFLDLVASNCYAKAFKRAEGVATINNALLRDQTGYQIGLWEAKIPAGATAITNAMLVDHRLDTTLCPNGEPVCGMVTGPMQIDTRMVIERFEREQRDFLARSQELRDEDRKECLQLIEDLRGLLAEDPAGALQNAIDSLEKRADRSDPIPGECRVFDSNERMPAFWLLANGGEVLREKYPDLFAAIGTKYGAGNGATTFNLPEIKPHRRAFKAPELVPVSLPPHIISCRTLEGNSYAQQFIQYGDDLLLALPSYAVHGFIMGEIWFIDPNFNISSKLVDRYCVYSGMYGSSYEYPTMRKVAVVNERTILSAENAFCINSSSWKYGFSERDAIPQIKGFPYPSATVVSIGKRYKRYYYYALANKNGNSCAFLESTEDFKTWKHESEAIRNGVVIGQTDPHQNTQMVVTDSHMLMVVHTGNNSNIGVLRVPLNKSAAPSSTIISTTGYSYIPKDQGSAPNGNYLGSILAIPIHLVHCEKQGRLILSIMSASNNTYASAPGNAIVYDQNTSFHNAIFESKDMGATWRQVFSEYIGTNQMARIRSIRVVNDQVLIVKKGGLFLFGGDNIMRPLPFSDVNSGAFTAYGGGDFCIHDAAWYQNRLVVSAGCGEFSRLYLSEPNFKGFVEDMPYGIYAGRVLER